MRISKYIAHSGLASRREAEKIIMAGRVKINGTIVNELGTKVDDKQDIVEVDGKILKLEQEKIYILLNKPAGYISTVYDPESRPTVIDLLKDINERVYPVGRLDFDTEGLLLLSNDGEFTNLMIHPRYKIVKKYEALVKGEINKHNIYLLQKGIILEDGLTAPAELKVIKQQAQKTLIEISIHEGKKRQIKRMFQAINHPVISLKRVSYAFLNLGKMNTGEYRSLKKGEVLRLIRMAKDGTVR